jgi:hypothetical protein
MQTKKINDAYVLENPAAPTRWLDIFGKCQKYDTNPGIAITSEWTTTVISDGAGTSAPTNSTTANSWVTITNAAGDYDGVSMQLKGENYAVNTSKPFYLETKVTVSEATQCDFAFGLIETDTTIFAVDTAHAIAVSGAGIFFSKLDAVTGIKLSVYSAGAAVSTTAVGTLSTSAIVLGMYYDGEGVHVYVDDVEVAYITDSLPTNAVTPTIDYHNGNGVANTCEIAYIKAYQA